MLKKQKRLANLKESFDEDLDSSFALLSGEAYWSYQVISGTKGRFCLRQNLVEKKLLVNVKIRCIGCYLIKLQQTTKLIGLTFELSFTEHCNNPNMPQSSLFYAI